MRCPECGADLTLVDAVVIEETSKYSGSFNPVTQRVEYGTNGSDSMNIVALCAECCEELPVVIHATMSLTLSPEDSGG